MSETPEKKHAWAKFGAKPGAAGPAAPLPTAPARAAAMPFSKSVVRPAAMPPPRPAPTAPAAPPPQPPVAKAAPSRPATRPAPAAPAPRPAAPAPRPPAPAARPASSVTAVSRTPADAGEKSSSGNAARSGVSDELARALALIAAENAAPAVTSAPFVSAAQREAIAQKHRKGKRLRRAKIVAAAAAALVVLHFVVTLILYRAPTDEALQAHAHVIAAAALPLYSSTDVPLRAEEAVAVLRDRPDLRTIRYYAEVTLRLRKSLYGPAATNGTVAYRQLQESLLNARTQDLKYEIFPANEGPQVPTLPQLLQLTHRAGESLVVRVPFEATRFGWSWRLRPAQLANRSVERTLTGMSLDRYEGTPHLIFGPDGAMADIRARMKAARTYIVAVAKEVQKHGNVQAVAEASAPATTPATIPQSLMTFDPDAAAVPETKLPAVNPDALAIPAPATGSGR